MAGRRWVLCGLVGLLAALAAEARDTLSLDGEWEVLPIAGLDFHYPPPADGWQHEREPQQASRYIDTFNGPYMPGVNDILTKGRVESDVKLEPGDLIFVPSRLINF